MNPFEKLNTLKPYSHERYELTIYQGGDCIKLKSDEGGMLDVLRVALKNGCGVHVVKEEKK